MRTGAPRAIGSTDLAAVGHVGELLVRHVLQRPRHVVGEQHGRISHALVIPVDGRQFQRLAVRSGIPDGEHGERRGREPDEAHGLVVVCRAGLARHRLADRARRTTGTVLDGAFHRLDHQSGVVRVEHLLRGGWRLVQFRPLAALHAGDDVQRRLLALVGDGGEAARHVDHAQTGVAERHVAVIGDLAFDAGRVRGLDYRVRAEMLLQIHVHRVDGVRRRLVQVDVAVTSAARVRHRLFQPGEAARRVAVEHSIEADARLDGRKQRERFHRGTDFVSRVGDVVELFLQVILARVQRDD